MFDASIFDGMSVKEKYENMLVMLEGLISDEESIITKLCNVSALINALVDNINWCGFYILKDNELILGPFQGMPACTKIKIGSGVCGTSVSSRKTMRVENVHCFEGHIACDAASNSELVIPIIKNNNVYGVLDLDSADVGRFTEIEQQYLEKSIEILNKYINWDEIAM
jgi:GAF domain-containing protein